MSEETKDVTEDKGTQEQPTTLTTEERLKRENSGLDRKVTELTKMNTELSQQLESLSTVVTSFKEKEKASLTETERKDLELKELTQTVKTLTDSLTQIKTEKEADRLKTYTLEKLGENSVDNSFAKFISGANEQEIDTSIADLIETLKKQQSEFKQNIVNQSSPKKGVNDLGNVTKEQFKRMTLSEQNELYNTNPELYRKYTNL